MGWAGTKLSATRISKIIRVGRIPTRITRVGRRGAWQGKTLSATRISKITRIGRNLRITRIGRKGA